MARKRNTFGSIERRARDTWRVRWAMAPDPETGERRRGSQVVHGSRADAERVLAQARLGTSRDGDEMTLEAFWKATYEPHIQGLRETTRHGYTQLWEANVRPEFGRTPLTSITRDRVQRWLDSMTYGTASHAYAVLRAMMTLAHDLELTEVNVMSKRYRLPRKDESRARAVNEGVHTQAELDQMLAACQGECWEACFLVSAFGGLRRSEAMGLMWKDVEFAWVPRDQRDPSAGQDLYAVLHVHQVSVGRSGEATITPTKTETSVRDVPVPPPYSMRLFQLRTERPSDVWLADDGMGQPMNPNTLSSRYRRWHVGQPFAYVPWKNLRNSYGTMLHAAGADFATLGKVMGHSTPTTTYKYYERPGVEQFVPAVSVLGTAAMPMSGPEPVPATVVPPSPLPPATARQTDGGGQDGTDALSALLDGCRTREEAAERLLGLLGGWQPGR